MVGGSLEEGNKVLPEMAPELTPDEPTINRGFMPGVEAFGLTRGDILGLGEDGPGGSGTARIG